MSSPAAGARYRISRRLGQGGMAEVFEAEVAGELGFVRKVAIKRMLGEAAADASAARRFLDEARIASRLHHANIVAVTDVGLLDGLPFQVLEFIDGLDAQRLQQRAGGVLPLDIALIITADVAHALEHAHRATDQDGFPLGVVHRDVKPSNVLVSWGGDIKLADFGIALAYDRSARTETGIVAGTLGFIAPEQRTRSEVDGRADVFALGLTLHALLTGYTPLRDITIEMELLEGKPLPLDAALPADVKALVARAVTPSRLDRPTAGEFASAVGSLLAPRIARDARSVMREFMQQFATNRPRAGALDALLGIDVVAADEPGKFETRASPEPVANASADAPTKVEPAKSSEPKPHRSRAGFYALGALLLMGTAGVVTWKLASRDVSSTRVSPDATASLRADPPDLVDASVATTLDSTVIDAAIAIGPTDRASESTVIDARIAIGSSNAADAVAIAPSDAAVAAPIAIRPRDRAPTDAVAIAPSDATIAIAKPDAKRGKPDKPDAAIAATTTETGWLQVVGGEELVGAQVIVDGGKWKFFVPYMHEVAVGEHRIEVIKPDGTKLPAKTIEVTTFHTRRKVARVTY